MTISNQLRYSFKKVLIKIFNFPAHRINKNYQQWLKTPLRPAVAKAKAGKQGFGGAGHVISIIVPVFNTPDDFLRQCIESVINQTYENWELILVDDASILPSVKNTVREYTKKDKRVKYLFRQENGNICQASNEGLAVAKGEYIGFLDHDDLLWPNALYEVIKILNQKPHVQFIYTDEDKIEENTGKHVDPFFKPDWSPELLRSVNYINHFTVIKKELISKTGNFRVGYEGAQDWDLYLRVIQLLEKTGFCHPLNPKNPIQHISKILYSWRKSRSSTASRSGAKDKQHAYINQKKVLEDDIKVRNCNGEITPTKYLGIWNVKYKIKGNPLVSIIIPTKDQYPYISKCLESLIDKSVYRNYELVIVDTGSSDKRVWQLYENIKRKHEKTKMLRWNGECNFSEVCNYGVKKAHGDYLLLLNNDTEIIEPKWIDYLLGFAQQLLVGAVGAKLLYPNGRIQHAGIIFDPKNKINGLTLPDHAYKCRFNNIDYGLDNPRLYSMNNYLAVTGACLMIDRKKYTNVGGFDGQFQIAFNDVDLCLSLFTKGYFNVCIPDPILIHHESVSVKKLADSSRNSKFFEKELSILHNKWQNNINNDPFTSHNYWKIYH